MAKAQTGLTRRLYNMAMEAQSRGLTLHDGTTEPADLASMYAIIDGPYGQNAGVST
jgi:hypothetical protein